MTTFAIIISCAILAMLASGIILFSMLKGLQKKISKKQSSVTPPKKGIKWQMKALLITATCLIIISFFSPFIFTRESINSDFNFKATGAIGDTIGGLMNPFIAIAGVIVTGLAFYVQYLANLQQREHLQIQIDHQNNLTRLQQFESQFFEMLRLHRENVKEMRISGYDFEEETDGLKRVTKTTEGRKCFVTMQKEFEAILSLFTKEEKLTNNGFETCYKIFFSGLDEFNKEKHQKSKFSSILMDARIKHENRSFSANNNIDRKLLKSNVKLYFNYKPFSGHSEILGHYFRHLFLTVKSVVSSDVVIDYDIKMKYLKILRASLSNHEQILLFYNWLGGYGEAWEDEENSFFTEYCMIHNLWYNKLFSDNFIKERVNYLRKKSVFLRTGPMFEID